MLLKEIVMFKIIGHKSEIALIFVYVLIQVRYKQNKGGKEKAGRGFYQQDNMRRHIWLQSGHTSKRKQ
jgi:hypothetical protein